MAWLLIIGGVVANASASLLLKSAMASEWGFNRASLLGLIREGALWLGLVLYFLAFVFYLASLRFFPLSVAHPITTSAAIVLVTVGALIIYKEQLDLALLVGIGFLVAGISVLALRAQ